MFIVVGIIMVGSAMAIPVTMRMVSDARGRQRVGDGRHFPPDAPATARWPNGATIELTFLSDNSMQVERIEVPSGAPHDR